MLKYVLLGFLNYKPLTGYELEGWINVSTGNFWHANLSQIYGTLKKLEEEAFVSSYIEPQEGRPDKRIYSITEDGKADLRAWISKPFLEHEIKKDTLLLKIFFADPGDLDTILTQLRLQLNLHREQLQRYQLDPPQAMIEAISAQPELMDNARLWESARRFGVMYEEMYIRWIEETMQTVESWR
jgi:DNA-binding PadR family transcriptional regulator